MGRVIVGVDPHKTPVTIEAIDEQGRVLATGRWPTDRDGYRLMLRYVRTQWPHHRWAVEGAQGVWAVRWRSGWSPRGRRCWTCRPSWPPGCGSSTPETPARPTPRTRTRSRWWRCARRG